MMEATKQSWDDFYALFNGKEEWRTACALAPAEPAITSDPPNLARRCHRSIGRYPLSGKRGVAPPLNTMRVDKEIGMPYVILHKRKVPVHAHSPANILGLKMLGRMGLEVDEDSFRFRWGNDYFTEA